MKKLWISLVVLVGIALVAGGVGLLPNKSNADACSNPRGSKQSYSVMIMNGKVEPSGTVQAKLCDTLTITNMDSIGREIAFGPHEDHVPYDGIAEKVLNKDQSLTITLNKAGTYHWHDHEHDEVEGYFKVIQ
jgi:plastocyanin